MSPHVARCALLVLAALTLPWLASGARADAGATKPAPVVADLQAPQQRSTRYSAYSLPDAVWSLEAGALGGSAEEAYGVLGVARGFKHGFQLNLNLVHWSAGLFHADVRWNFLERPHFALGADLGFSYAHGAWIWVLGDYARELISDADLIGVPVSLTASAPINRWLQFDLMVEGRYTQMFGTLGRGNTFFAETDIGARQVLIRPTARVYVSDSTALELTAKLAAFNRVPVSIEPGGDSRFGTPRHGYADVAFSDSWNIELGVRSRIRRWVYATVRIQYGQTSKFIYGASVFPMFGLEFRL
jgi:hypothetical protein